MPSEAMADSVRTNEEVARCARLVRIYPSATGETHALRGVEAAFDRRHGHGGDRPVRQRQVEPARVLALRERQSGGELWLDGDA